MEINQGSKKIFTGYTLLLMLILGIVVFCLQVIYGVASDPYVYHVLFVIPILIASSLMGLKIGLLTAGAALATSLVLISLNSYVTLETTEMSIPAVIIFHGFVCFASAIVVGLCTDRVLEKIQTLEGDKNSIERALYYQKKDQETAFDSLQRTKEETTEQINRFSSLAYRTKEMTLTIGANLKPEDLYKVVVDNIMEILEVEKCALYTHDSMASCFIAVHQSEAFQEEGMDVIIDDRDPLYAHIREAKQPLVVTAENVDDFRIREIVESSPFHPSLCIPLMEGDEIIALVLATDRPSEDAILMGLHSIIADISRMALINGRLYEEKREMSKRDGLTGVFNFGHFREQLGELLRYYRDHNLSLSIIMSDIDHFKQFNDSFGHQAGDAVLVEFARVCQEMADGRGLFARYGGEEFIFTVNGATAEEAAAFANQVRQRISEIEVPYDGQTLKVTCSFGVSTTPEHASEIEDLIKMADMGLYKAKRGGRNQACVYDPEFRIHPEGEETDERSESEAVKKANHC